jgi:hypothetical protein
MFRITTNALDRLEEAKELLADMRGLQRDPNMFRHRANQFVAAMRSVSAMLKADYGKRPEFDAWWKLTDTRNVPALNEIKELRDRALKEGVLTHQDFGNATEALQTFQGHLEVMTALVDDAMARFEGKG